MKRSPLVRKTPLARTGRLKQRSRKTAADADERVHVVAQVWMRDGGRCRCAGWAVECGGPMDVHERIPRSKWAAGYLDVDNCLLVCRAHHDQIHHVDPRGARAAGYLA